MSGTSLDGIDAAIIETDGRTVAGFGPKTTVPYDAALRQRLRDILGSQDPVDDVARELTEAHAALVSDLLARNGLKPADIRVVGFHGQTIDHRPKDGVTRQIGDGALLADRTGIDVVCDFRSTDVAAGGEGAPLAPLFHQALCARLERPIAVLNIGGIANLTWIGPGDQLIAFDTGPGNALLDDWVHRHTGKPYDSDGTIAASGTPDAAIVEAYLRHPYFARRPPKSLDRLDFDLAPVGGLGVADGASTLVALTCASVARAQDHMPTRPRRWLVTGGGRHNQAMMAGLAVSLSAPFAPVEDAGWDGDALEAQAFAFLAMRSLDGLALSIPTTTGVPEPMPGGRLYRAKSRPRPLGREPGSLAGDSPEGDPG